MSSDAGSFNAPPAPPGDSVDGALSSPNKLFGPASPGALEKRLFLQSVDLEAS